MGPDEHAGGPRRVYDLRVSALGEAPLREAVTHRLVACLPGSTPDEVRRALGGAGLRARLELGDPEAAALLRELYASGVPPIAVALVPARTRPADDAQSDFAPFLARGGRFAPTWNWRAFVFGPLWYLKQGLYLKGLVLLGLTLVPVWNLPVTFTVSMAVLTYCGLMGNWDHYLWRVKRRQGWW
jgi:hypothetical protein